MRKEAVGHGSFAIFEKKCLIIPCIAKEDTRLSIHNSPLSKINHLVDLI
ncbi:hypothetical protein SAMN05216323_10044 [Williamwhitmania taraxaci]|uniref:Uncharacterized protein n=1 Tax=Williamwhitmania taraxaci TaxID=1640674 RepID=A0A1G6GT66_9BACT|nr:hypothetical protein SAMN05216323_10044 [Williamwhitmania taraxaci]